MPLERPHSPPGRGAGSVESLIASAERESRPADLYATVLLRFSLFDNHRQNTPGFPAISKAVLIFLHRYAELSPAPMFSARSAHERAEAQF